MEYDRKYKPPTLNVLDDSVLDDSVLDDSYRFMIISRSAHGTFHVLLRPDL